MARIEAMNGANQKGRCSTWSRVLDDLPRDGRAHDRRPRRAQARARVRERVDGRAQARRVRADAHLPGPRGLGGAPAMADQAGRSRRASRPTRIRPRRPRGVPRGHGEGGRRGQAGAQARRRKATPRPRGRRPRRPAGHTRPKAGDGEEAPRPPCRGLGQPAGAEKVTDEPVADEPAADEPAADEPAPDDAPADDAPTPHARPAGRPDRSRRRRAPGGASPCARTPSTSTSAWGAARVRPHPRQVVEEARAILAHTPRAVARDWSKLLESAVANAEHNHELIGDELRIDSVTADEADAQALPPRAMAGRRASASARATSRSRSPRRSRTSNGTEVHPESMRVGYIHDWKSNWFNEA